LLAALLTSAAQRTQVIIATQSVTLVNQLTPDQLWTVDRANGESVFSRLDAVDMSEERNERGKEVGVTSGKST
jgi:predicted ATPase